jgi:integrase
MASFNYNLQQPYIKDKNGNKRLNPEKTRLYLFVIENRDNVMKLKTEHFILPIQWDFKKQLIKQQIAESTIKNDLLNNLKKSVESEFYKLRHDFPQMKWIELNENLKVFIKEEVSPVYSEKYKSFFTVFDEFIEAYSHEVSDLTIGKFKTIKKSLMEFKPDLTFDDIDLKFYEKYIQYLRRKGATGRQKTRPDGLQEGLLNATIGKYIECLKLFLKWSYDFEYHKNDIFKHSKFKTNQKSKKQQQEGKNDIVSLRIDEVFQLYNFDFSNNVRLERVRDLFCFMCFTLQRWSDVIRFESSQIRKDQFGGEIVPAWLFRSYKTGKETIVPFAGDYLSKAYEILEKYKFSLPVISEQKFNLYIKEACKLAGLEREKAFKRYVGQKEILSIKPLHEYISSHSGRRTGISILLNVYHMPIHFVRDLSGHSDLKTLDGYLEKDNTSLVNSLIKNTVGFSPLKIAK